MKVYRGRLIPKVGESTVEKERRKLYNRFVKEEELYLNNYYLDRAYALWKEQKLTPKRLIAAIPKLKNQTDPQKGNYSDGSARQAWLETARRPVIRIDQHGKETLYPSICDAIRDNQGHCFSSIFKSIKDGHKAYGFVWRYQESTSAGTTTPPENKIGFILG